MAGALFFTACSSDSADSPSASTAPSDTGSNAAGDATDACSVLAPADFAVVGFTVDAEGEDVSENFNVATTSSVACQWTNFDDNVGGSWELIIGTGDAEAAYEFEVSFAELDTFTTLDIGDAEAIAALATLVANRLAA